MTLKEVNINGTLSKLRQQLKDEQDVSPALRATIEMLLVIVTLLAQRLGLNSRNSSMPPSSDPHRTRKEKKPGDKKVGGQNGHVGATLSKVESPDKIEVITLDKRTLPRGHYHDRGFESRQVIDIELSCVVTEYRAQILEDDHGQRYVAPFPPQVTRPVQYGVNLKAHAVYLSQFQLIPYQRIQDHFRDQMQVPVSVGTLFNINQQAYELLAQFDAIAVNTLAASALLHADETGINVNGKTLWLHCASNDQWTHFRAHANRGTQAMNDIGILPKFNGILCHDHWKPYFTYDCTHALCNAHHLRELERAWEQDHQTWAQRMKMLLEDINTAVHTAGGQLMPEAVHAYRTTYRQLLAEAHRECPPPDERTPTSKRGRRKRSKARNLLERLVNYENDVLRFMENPIVPFTNNQGENDLRMTKVQQKISGCFRSMEGAQIFCRIRGYLSTCRKHGVAASEALTLLFQGTMPAFVGEGAE